MQAICRLISFFLHVIKVLFFSGKPSIVTNIITCLRLVVLWDFVLRLRRRTLHFKHLDTFSISQKKYILNSLYRKKKGDSFPYGQVLFPVWRGPKSGRGICNPRLSCYVKFTREYRFSRAIIIGRTSATVGLFLGYRRGMHKIVWLRARRLC